MLLLSLHHMVDLKITKEHLQFTKLNPDSSALSVCWLIILAKTGAKVGGFKLKMRLLWALRFQHVGKQ